MIHQRIQDIQSEGILGLLDELCDSKGFDFTAHRSMSLFEFLSQCQKDYLGDKKERINAANFYKGSALKTKIEKLEDDLFDMTYDLCQHFRVSHELVTTKTLYVFLNDIFNPKSKLRKPVPIRW